MPPTISVTIASDDLGLAPGDVAQIDAAVRRLPREALVLRIVSVLNALAALGKEARDLSVDFARRPFEHINDLFARMRVPGGPDPRTQFDDRLDNLASWGTEIVSLEIDARDSRLLRSRHVQNETVPTMTAPTRNNGLVLMCPLLASHRAAASSRRSTFVSRSRRMAWTVSRLR